MPANFGTNHPSPTKKREPSLHLRLMRNHLTAVLKFRAYTLILSLLYCANDNSKIFKGDFQLAGRALRYTRKKLHQKWWGFAFYYLLSIINGYLSGIEKNFELHKQITFDELIQHGKDNWANIVNGMPWSWEINGKTITHENDSRYIIETLDGLMDFENGSDTLIAYESGLRIMTHHNTHSPSGCPM